MNAYFLDTIELEIPFKSSFVKLGQRIDFKCEELNQHFTGIVSLGNSQFVSMNTPAETFGGVSFIANTGKDFVIKWRFDFDFNRNIYNKPQEMHFDINGKRFSQEWYIKKEEIKLNGLLGGSIQELPTSHKIVGVPVLFKDGKQIKTSPRNIKGRKSYFSTDAPAGEYLARIDTLKGTYYANISILSKENEKYDLIPEIVLKGGKTYKNAIIGTVHAELNYNIRFAEKDVRVYRVNEPVKNIQTLSRTKQVKNNGEFFVISNLQRGLNFFVATKSDGIKTHFKNFRILCK